MKNREDKKKDFEELRKALEAASKASDYLRTAYEAFTPVANAPASISTGSPYS